MIIGIGNDVTSISRIKELLNKNGERFENRCFTKLEITKAHSRKNAGQKIVAATYAKRYAAKEACAKAIGTGIGKDISFHDIEINNNKRGCPNISLSSHGLKYVNSLIPQGYIPVFHLALSDDNDMAWAMVTLSATSI